MRSRKLYVFYTLIVFSVFTLCIRFYILQIRHADVYQEKSAKNSIRVLTQLPVRGNIFDRYGILIADNRPSFSLYLIPAQTTSHTLEFVTRLLQQDREKIRQKLRHAGPFQPVKIARSVHPEILTIMQENILELPGLEWRVEPRRHYNIKNGFAHVLGTLGEVDEQELMRNPEYELGDIVGKKGIEKAADRYLRGRKGFKYVRVDALGRTVEEIKTAKNSPPYPGMDMYLTIDARLQQYADTLFQGKRGALVAIDVTNGEIITMLSKPDYDLEYFVGTVDPQIWQELIADTTHPLYDRACQSSYPPGSTYKLVAAIAALNENIITPSWSAYCPGYFQIGRKTIRCWNPEGHGTLDLLGAIKHSCNVYFYQLGLKIGIDAWSKYSILFLFGKKTGIELTNENTGLVPSREYYDQVFGKGKWTRGMLANLAIGQGELLVTPLQLAQFGMIIANKGKYYTPHLILKLVDRITGEEQKTRVEAGIIEGIQPGIYELIHRGMREVVNGGTGWRANIIGIEVAGKTGTAQNPHGKPHAWFLGFAPYGQPRIALVVLVENGGSGGGIAAPIAGNYLRKYFYYQGMFDYRKELAILKALREKQKQQAREDSLRQIQEIPEDG